MDRKLGEATWLKRGVIDDTIDDQDDFFWVSHFFGFWETKLRWDIILAVVLWRLEEIEYPIPSTGVVKPKIYLSR